MDERALGKGHVISLFFDGAGRDQTVHLDGGYTISSIGGRTSFIYQEKAVFRLYATGLLNN
jgi:hypothetical protein